MLKKNLFGVMTLIVGVMLAFTLIGCDTGNEPTGGGAQTVTYTGTASSVTYTLKITENTSRAAYTPQSGDTYELTAGANKSTGAVNSFSANVLTLQPTRAGASSFTATVSGSNLTNLTGNTTWDNGTAFTAPGALTTGGNGGMGNPNTGGSTPAQAIPLTQGEWITASVATGGEQWFSYVPPENGPYSIHVRLGTINRVILEHYNSAITQRGDPKVFSKNASNPVLLETTGTVTAGQTYYVKMYPDDGESGGTYQIGFTGIPNWPLQPGEICPPATYTTVTTEEAWINGISVASGEIQWFRYDRPNDTARNIHARFIGSPNTAYMRLFYMDNGVAKEAGTLGVGSLSENYYNIHQLNPGTIFYIRVWGRGAGTYRLAVTSGSQPPQ